MNKHTLKKKLKNINRELSKAYKTKYFISQRILLLERSRDDVRVLINKELLEGKTL